MISAFVFYLKASQSSASENFLFRLYETISQKTGTKEITIQSALGFPDLWNGLFVFIFYFLIVLVFMDHKLPGIERLYPFYLFGVCALLLIGIFIILLIVMIARPAIAARVVFVLIGFGLCVPVAIYTNAPIELSFAGDIQSKMGKKLGIEQHNFQELKSNTKKPLIRNLRRISWYYLLCCGLILSVSAILFIVVSKIPMRILKDYDKFFSSHPDSDYYKALQPQKKSRLFHLLVILLWLLISMFNLLGLYWSLSIFEKNIFDTNSFFPSELATMLFENIKTVLMIVMISDAEISTILIVHKLIMLAYSLPAILIFLFVLRKNIQSAWTSFALLQKPSKENTDQENYLTKKVKDICRFANVKLPVIRIVDTKDIDAKTKYLGFPIYRNTLIVSKKMIEELQGHDDEMDALLAHEIGHMKQHNFTRRLLCLFSDYSLFGNGFLALLQNSFQMEKEADEFSIQWLSQKYSGKKRASDILQSLLERIEEIQWKNKFFTAGVLRFSMSRNDDYRRELINVFDNSSMLKKIKINLQLMSQMYFGEEIISYFHPPIIERISWIQKNEILETN